MDEPRLGSEDRVGNGEEILPYFASFYAATNSDKLSGVLSVAFDPPCPCEGLPCKAFAGKACHQRLSTLYVLSLLSSNVSAGAA
jgi:hypothetical protein